MQAVPLPVFNHNHNHKMIQHRAARFVLNKPWHRSNQNHDSITDMLTSLEWPTLQNRRTIARLTFLFKIVRNLLAVPDHCLQSPTPVSSTRAQHPLKLTQLQTRVDMYKYSFLPRTINGTPFKFLTSTQ